MGQHGPQCICEICTCGRHQCPFDRHKNQTGLSLGEEGEGGGGGHFYRKEFATVENGGQRTRPTRPKGELTLNDAPFSAGRNDNELRPALASGGDARNERFVTSAALRKRAQNSQIELGNSTGGMRSTYREESERALQNGGAERSRPSRQTASTQLFRNETETPKTTIHRTEFGAKRSEKVQATRPRTSDLWKKEGTVEGTTTTREQFAEKRPERNQPFRPKENAPILGDGDRAFQRETSNLSEYGPKRAERQGGRRPPDSDLFKSGEPLLERATVNRSEYGQGGRGERFERTMRANEGAELLRGDGTFLSETSKNAEFQPKRGDRFEAKVQGSSDIWKSGDRLEGRGVNREEYGREGRGDRFPAHRPMESGILKGEGSFATETLKRVEFGPKQGQRAEAARPRTSDLWKQNQSKPMANGQTTVTRSEYRGGRGERFEMRKPPDSDILRAQGKFDAESVAHSEFGEKGAGERFAARRPGTNEVWRREGRMAENGSVNRVEYTIEGKRGERHEMRRPKDEPLFDPDIDPSQPPLSTVHRTEFVQRKGERAARNVRTDEGAELLRGDGTFLNETSKNAEFQPKRGDRFEAKVQGSSDIWKTEGKMDGQTVNREEYRQMKGERAEARRPEESGILRGEGSFATETHKRVEFGPKQGQRAEAARPADSELFRREGKIGMEGSVNRTDYSHTQGETAERRIQKESGILMPTEGSEFARSTVHRDDYNQKIREEVHPHRPTQSWRLEGPQADFSTVTREDYVEKRLEAGEHSPVRRRGNESSFGLADELENAEFGRTMTQDEFGIKELGERSRPVVHHSELSITEPRATFHSNTMYSDNFQQISPDSYGTRTKVRPSTALKLSGDRELSSGYQMEYTNKIMPCPAGELMDSLKNHQCEEAPKEHPHTDNFEFHSVNKGHHLYRSRENLAEN